MNDFINIIKQQVPNVSEYFTDKELGNIYESIQKDEYLKKQDFVYAFKMTINLWMSHEYRICSECGCIMQDGYCVDMGEEYYCSDECLHKHYTDEEWEQECEDNDQSYYTEWY